VLETIDRSAQVSDVQQPHPKEAGPQPPFKQPQQEYPGSEARMDPRPDFGEDSYEGRGLLKDRAAIITGGDSGIGRAVATAFAREGADVVISYLNEDEDAEETARVVRDAGRRVELVPGDIGSPEQCRALVERTMNTFDRVDVLVNNAAFQMSYDRLTDIPPDEIEYVFRTNIVAMFWLCQAAIPRMKPGSTIVNSASIQAYDPTPSLMHYAATKAAIVNFTKALAQQLIDDGIRVNAVAPGPVWTPLIPSTFDEEKIKKFGQNDPMGRPAQPAELAPAYGFLASDESRFVNGEVLGVTGGRPLP
jgi:NAD(P)-dependent dehydrogenase (short-subunit alcohol dehydrogenase family)